MAMRIGGRYAAATNDDKEKRTRETNHFRNFCGIGAMMAGTAFGVFTSNLYYNGPKKPPIVERYEAFSDEEQQVYDALRELPIASSYPVKNEDMFNTSLDKAYDALVRRRKMLQHERNDIWMNSDTFGCYRETNNAHIAFNHIGMATTGLLGSVFGSVYLGIFSNRSKKKD